MAIKIKGNPVIDDYENLDIDGNAEIGGYVKIGTDSNNWELKAGDDGDLRIKRGNTTLFQMQGDPVTGRLWLNNRIYAPGTASFGSLNGEGGTGDKRLEINAEPGDSAILRIQSELDHKWDISAKSTDFSGALQFRPNGLTTGRMVLHKDGTLNVKSVFIEEDTTIRGNVELGNEATDTVDVIGYQTITINGTKYCPLLAMKTKSSQQSGYFKCYDNGRTYSLAMTSGWADERNGVIGHYHHTSSPAMYWSDCMMYDINCLESGYEPSYMAAPEMLSNSSNEGSNSDAEYNGIHRW